MDNPLRDLAEEKFKEVQEAYDEIMKDRRMEGIITDTARVQGTILMVIIPMVINLMEMADTSSTII